MSLWVRYWVFVSTFYDFHNTEFKKVSRKYNLKLLLTRDLKSNTLTPDGIHSNQFTYKGVFSLVILHRFHNQRIPNKIIQIRKWPWPLSMTLRQSLTTTLPVELKHTKFTRLWYPIQFITCTTLLIDINYMHTFKESVLFEEKDLQNTR